MHPPPLLPPQSLPGPWRRCRRTAMIWLSWRSPLLAMRAPPRTGDGPGRLRRLQAALAFGPFTKDRNDIANGFRNYGSRLQNLLGEGLISAVVNVANSKMSRGSLVPGVLLAGPISAWPTAEVNVANSKMSRGSLVPWVLLAGPISAWPTEEVNVANSKMSRGSLVPSLLLAGVSFLTLRVSPPASVVLAQARWAKLARAPTQRVRQRATLGAAAGGRGCARR